MMNCFYNLFKKFYECPVCFNIFTIRNFILIKCGHLSCVNCSKLLRKCSICRKEITERYNIGTIFSVKCLSNKIRYIYCPYCRCVFIFKGINTGCICCSNESDLFRVYFS